jgi:hypothetical protein
MTTPSAKNTDIQSKSLVTSASYENFAYRRRFIGNAITDSIVEIAVIVTLKAKSALNNEHHLYNQKVYKEKKSIWVRETSKKGGIFDIHITFYTNSFRFQLHFSSCFGFLFQFFLSV